jgi:thioesterase domain-containing protein
MSEVQEASVSNLPSFEPREDAIQRPALRRDRLNLANAYVAPRGANERWVAGTWQEILRVDRIGSQDDFFELGGDSLAVGALFERVASHTGSQLAPSTIVDHPTVASLAALLERGPDANSGRCLVTLETGGEGPPLFLFHELSGQVLAYRHLLRRLGGRRRAYGLQYPDQDRDPLPQYSIPELAGTYAKAIRDADSSGPYALIGYSVGGVLAYETACRLAAAGGEIALMLLIDSGAKGAKLKGLQQIARKLMRHLMRLSDEAPRRWPAYLVGLLGEEHKRLKRIRSGPRPEDVPRGLGHMIYDNNQQHHPSAYGGPIKLLRCAGGLWVWGKLDLGWGAYADGPLEIIEVGADHVNIMREPMVGLIAACLDHWLPLPEAGPPAR